VGADRKLTRLRRHCGAVARVMANYSAFVNAMARA
jgi:hypothetical protein